MAIGSVDQLINGMQAPVPIAKIATGATLVSQYYSPFYAAGSPGAAVAPSPGLNGTSLTSYAGQITFPAAVAGQFVYVAGLDVAQGASIGAVLLCDRVWHNSGITMTTTGAQAITTPAFPARDRTASTAGDGYLVGLEVSTTTGNGAPITNTTLSYTNQAGTSGRTATIASFPTTAGTSTFVPFAFAAGDKGIQAIASITLGTSYVSGTMHLVVYRIIAQIGTPVANVSAPLAPGTPRRMWDNSVPFLLCLLAGTTPGAVSGVVQYAQG